MPDALISEGATWDFDWEARAAYNSQNGEYLVVWHTFNIAYQSTDPKFFGPVRGQRIKENGNKIGAVFDIVDVGVLPDVAYNPQTNEYLVVAEQWLNVVGQRLDGSAAKIGGQTTLIPQARFPRVVYNSLQGNYLVAGAWPDTTHTTPGSCQLSVTTARAGADGKLTGGINKVTTVPQLSDAVDKFALAYAPLEAADPVLGWNPTPGGRYLLAIGEGPQFLLMLDSAGKVVPAVFDPYYNVWYEYANFGAPGVLSPTGVDVAFGNWVTGPVFFFVWSDTVKEHYFGYEWTGVKAGVLDATRTCHLTTDNYNNPVYPLSWIVSHWDRPKEWRPRVTFNPATKEFLVAWRETPGTDPSDATVNHIRFNTSKGFKIPPDTNTVVSSTAANGNPFMPFVASSTTSTSSLVGWLDFRWWLGRTFGAFVDASTRQVSAF
jgi:hypothetical protein